MKRDTGPTARLRDLGHLRPILRDGMLESYLGWAIEAKDDFFIWAGPVRHAVVVRPESARAVLGGSEDFERNVAPTANLFGDGLLRLDGALWRERRQIFAPPFRTEQLFDLVPIVQDEAARLIALWRSREGAFKPSRDLSFTMLRILGRLLFGFEFVKERHGGRALHRSLITLSTDSVLRHFVPRPLVWAMNRREVRAARQFLDGLCGEILDTGASTPFMDALRASVARKELDRATAIDELRTFMIAGHETSATAIAWTIATVASHPHLVAALGTEPEAAVTARVPSDVEALEGTTRLVKEVMRLYPPVPISISRAIRDTTLGRLHIPRGTPVDVCSFVLHRLPWQWPRPDLVDPDRFARAPSPGTWLPFLLGPHTCLGARVAMVELPLVVARVLEAFELLLPEGPPRVNLRLSLHPAQLKIAVRPRERAARVATA